MGGLEGGGKGELKANRSGSRRKEKEDEGTLRD